jgi:hypothetical protein
MGLSGDLLVLVFRDALSKFSIGLLAEHSGDLLLLDVLFLASSFLNGALNES